MFLVIAIIAIFVLSFMLFLALFEPGLDYKIYTQTNAPLDSAEFLRTLEAIAGGRVCWYHPLRWATSRASTIARTAKS